MLLLHQRGGPHALLVLTKRWNPTQHKQGMLEDIRYACLILYYVNNKISRQYTPLKPYCGYKNKWIWKQNNLCLVHVYIYHSLVIEYWLWASKENKNDKTLDLRSFRFCLNLIKKYIKKIYINKKIKKYISQIGIIHHSKLSDILPHSTTVSFVWLFFRDSYADHAIVYI